ncbi:MAG: hypothetical protein AABX39_06835, partial [Nanoarchaeota archaeon]
NIATVWCSCPAFNKKIEEIMNFYPGNDYVDWWGIDLFGVRHFKDNNDSLTEKFVTLAQEHKKPVMVGESSATRVGVLNGEASWNEWFEPFFKWLRNHSNVKAFCYINWNWAIDWKTPEWGNCRIEENEIVKEKYIEELNRTCYLHHLQQKPDKIIY